MTPYFWTVRCCHPFCGVYSTYEGRDRAMAADMARRAGWRSWTTIAGGAVLWTCAAHAGWNPVVDAP
ncbi:MAG TPA: hypothetical protein VEB22_15290 [Phycisphaerales bacterium]|nr:hypothetical protein [Phycisphaerales bacterium]